MQITNFFAASQQVPPPPPPSDQPPAKRRSRKKLYVTLAALVVVIVVVAALFVPPGTATIPLKVDYVVGEKMVYDSTIDLSLDLGTPLAPSLNTSNTTSVDAQQTIEVVSFDGENYLLNHTMAMDVLGKAVSISMMEKMNKTGYSTYFFDLGGIQQEIPSSGPTGSTVLAQLLSRPEVKVGETVTIPFPSVGSSQNVQTSGDLTLAFSQVQDLTVPAGTYKVFRIDITSSNLKMTITPPETNQTVIDLGDLTMNLDLNYQIYLEYGTLRQIKSFMQYAGSYDSSFLNMTVEMGMDMTLTQHIKP